MKLLEFCINVPPQLLMGGSTVLYYSPIVDSWHCTLQLPLKAFDLIGQYRLMTVAPLVKSPVCFFFNILNKDKYTSRESNCAHFKTLIMCITYGTL